jgi:cytochrome P450
VTEDVTVRGTVIPAGSRAQLLWGAANRDEERYDDGERFLIGRPKPAAHVSFGTGMHFCLGALLARFQSNAAFSSLLTQTSEIEPAGEAEVNTTMMPILRGHARVPISAT